jgi:hypothetical protein
MNTINLVLTTVINQKIVFYTERFVEEVEQVRKAIGADSSTLCDRKF